MAEKQRAVQIVGPDELAYTSEKEISSPGPYQILAEVEAVGLCFSDMKLLKQFSSHGRKSDVTAGVDTSILPEIPSYVPNEKPTVPGHEAVVRVVEVGDKVTVAKKGERFLVQADYRWVKTATTNAAFGYNFEGGLQEYTLLDERIVVSSDGINTLLPVSDGLSASAVGLIEPWACVEQAYAVKERQALKASGRLLVVADAGADTSKLKSFLDASDLNVTSVGIDLESASDKADSIESLQDESFDDVIYFGSDADTAEQLFAKVAAFGLINFVQDGKKFGREISLPVGRTHYGGIRIVGTTGNDPAESMKTIPATGEIREGDKINVIGAGGPMGVMHVVRDLTVGVKDVTVFAGDVDDARLEALAEIATPLTEGKDVSFQTYNATKGGVTDSDYIAIMAPIPKLVEGSLGQAAERGIINIFAGIPAHVLANIDLDLYIERKLYFVATSGSTMDDMKAVLDRVEAGTLDTNISVAAVCGLEHAIEGIRAVENRAIAGKIVVYPKCKDLALTTLDKLGDVNPDAAQALNGVLWTKEAEDKL